MKIIKKLGVNAERCILMFMHVKNNFQFIKKIFLIYTITLDDAELDIHVIIVVVTDH